MNKYVIIVNEQYFVGFKTSESGELIGLFSNNVNDAKTYKRKFVANWDASYFENSEVKKYESKNY